MNGMMQTALARRQLFKDINGFAQVHWPNH